MCPLPLVSVGRGPQLGAQQASGARVGQANPLLSSPAPPVPDGPSSLPLLISLASLLCPQDQCGWGGRGGPWRAGDWPSSSAGSLGPSGWGSCPLLLSSSGRAPPVCLSWSSWPPSYAPKDPRSLEEVGPWRAGDQPGSSAGSPCPGGWGSCPRLLSRSPWMAPLACLS